MRLALLHNSCFQVVGDNLLTQPGLGDNWFWVSQEIVGMGRPRSFYNGLTVTLANVPNIVERGSCIVVSPRTLPR